MAKVIYPPDTNAAHMFLPEQESMLYFYLRKGESVRFNEEEYIFGIKEITAPNLSVSRPSGKLEYYAVKDGEALFWLTPRVYRGTIDPCRVVSGYPRKLEQFIKPTIELDSNHEVIHDTLTDIMCDLSPYERTNPYDVSAAINHWVNKNISYTIVPERVINRCVHAITESEDRMNNIPQKILKSIQESYGGAKKMHWYEKSKNIMKPIKMMDWFDFILEDRESQKEHSLERERGIIILENLEEMWWMNYHCDGKDEKESIQEMMMYLNEMFPELQNLWLESELTASSTLSTRKGKCVGIANAAAALHRAACIPSITAEGLSPEESYGCEATGHRWLLAYLSPYGWVEADPPTLGFNACPGDYAYQLTGELENTRPHLSLLGPAEGNDDLKHARKLISADKREENAFLKALRTRQDAPATSYATPVQKYWKTIQSALGGLAN